MNTIEVFGQIDSNGVLKINKPLPLKEGDVKVIIFYSENDELSEEQLWMKSLSNNPAFDFLKNEEDIYSLTDGKPFDD